MAADDDVSEDAPKGASPKPAATKGSAHDALLADPKLKKLIKSILRAKGIPAQEINDLAQDVLVALVVWSRKETTGDTEEDLAAGARTITRQVAADFWDRVAVAGKYLEATKEGGDEYAPRPNGSTVDPLDLKRILAEINGLIERGEISARAAALLKAVCEDTTLAEHANDTDQKPEAVRKMRERTQDKVVAHLQARKMTDVGLLGLWNRSAAIAVAVAVAVVFGLLAYQGRLAGILDIPVAWRGKPPPQPEAPVGPPPSIEAIAKALTPPSDDRGDKAARELLRAEQDYKSSEWDDCLRHVGEAKALDPHIGDAPELSHGCATEREKDMDAKKGRPHRPKR